jgi:NAD-dependent dihydropyrimidine dehydrogenase PreA subunit
MGNCYEIKELIVNGKKKRVSVAMRPENCLGDCHCHKTCPVIGGAMVCAPKEI